MMPTDYQILAPVYEQIGMADFAKAMTQRLIDYAQRSEWMGRRILDLGCGTGQSLNWLAKYGYITTGIDQSPAMLAATRQLLQEGGFSTTLHERDIRSLDSGLGKFDLVLALDVMNEMNSLRDLEVVFSGVQQHLEPGKLFIFDMHTIQGLTERGTSGQRILYDRDGACVFKQDSYDYERQISERRYVIFREQGGSWQRTETRQVLRAFPAQAVAGLLQRSGFSSSRMVQLNFEAFDPGTTAASRIVMIAER